MAANDTPSFGQLSGGPGRKQREGRVVSASVLGYSKVEFCTHALDRMKQRRVTQVEVIATIRNPTQSGLPVAMPDRRRVRRPRGKSEAVDVVYVEQSDRIVVVTVIVIKLKRRRTRKP